MNTWSSWLQTVRQNKYQCVTSLSLMFMSLGFWLSLGQITDLLFNWNNILTSFKYKSVAKQNTCCSLWDMIFLVLVILTELTSNEQKPIGRWSGRIRHQWSFLNELVPESSARGGIHPTEKENIGMLHGWLRMHSNAMPGRN